MLNLAPHNFLVGDRKSFTFSYSLPN